MNAIGIEHQPLRNAAARPGVDVVGEQRDFFHTLHTLGSLTPDELAKVTGVEEEFALGWLHQEAARGHLEYSWKTQRFRLRPEIGALVQEQS